MSAPDVVNLVALIGVIVFGLLSLRSSRQARRSAQQSAAWADVAAAWRDLETAVRAGAGADECARLRTRAYELKARAASLDGTGIRDA